MKKTETFTAHCPSPLGVLTLSATKKKIISINFDEDKSPSPSLPPILEKGIKQIEEYFGGHRKTFSLPLELEGTEFQTLVWKELLKIPYGETRAYGDIASNIGRPKAMRAVGAANGSNRISLVIPCHRVIGKDGKLVGYGSGLWRKEWLLGHEGIL